MSERVIDFHPIAIPSPKPNVRPTDGQTPMSPPGSAIFSQSESDVEDAGPTMKYGSQEDASILYSRPQRWPKTRTLSAVSRFLRLQVSLSTIELSDLCSADGRVSDDLATAQHVRSGPEQYEEPAHVARSVQHSPWSMQSW